MNVRSLCKSLVGAPGRIRPALGRRGKPIPDDEDSVLDSCDGLDTTGIGFGSGNPTRA